MMLGIHGGEVKLGDVLVQAGGGRVDQAALVGDEQVDAGLERLGMALLPRHEHAAAPGGGDLHGADARAGGDTRNGLDRQTGQAGDLECSIEPVVVGQEGVLAIDVPAAEEQVLLVAEDDAAVGEVGMGLLMGDGLGGIAVERQGQAVMVRELQQARQQIGVAVGADDQVGIVALEQVAQAEHQAASVAAREGVLAPVDLDEEFIARRFPEEGAWSVVGDPRSVLLNWELGTGPSTSLASGSLRSGSWANGWKLVAGGWEPGAGLRAGLYSSPPSSSRWSWLRRRVITRNGGKR